MADYPHLEGSTFADYAKRIQEKEGLDTEIVEASEQQEERASTPDTDWETRYKELEQHNSRQAQELGTLRQENTRYSTAFDEYLLNSDPTPADDQPPEPTSITSDDLWERPDEVINQAVENHPAIREAKVTAEERRKAAILAAKADFEARHPNYQDTIQDAKFAEWVQSNGTRTDLAARADNWDFGAADALFSLYEQEQALNGTAIQNIANRDLEIAQLEEAGVGSPPPEAKYSRVEMREKMIFARQGNLQAQRYLDANLPAYRAALASGNVTD